MRQRTSALLEPGEWRGLENIAEKDLSLPRATLGEAGWLLCSDLWTRMIGALVQRLTGWFSGRLSSVGGKLAFLF